ncbi:6304_t:CDS:2, partial [Racocetra fulgida]
YIQAKIYNIIAVGILQQNRNYLKEELLIKAEFLVALTDYNHGKYKTSFENFEKVSKNTINTQYKNSAKYYLALQYKNGKPILNDNKAHDLFNQVAQSDSTYKDDAKYMLALYKKAKSDDRKAFDLFKQVAESDLTYEDNAKYMLAKCYESGLGVEKDYKMAYKKYLNLLKSNDFEKGYKKNLKLNDIKFELAKCYANNEATKDVTFQLYLDLSKCENQKYQIDAL